MKSSFWTPYISDNTIHAICWTLIHSLWIGLAIALLSGLVISITRKSSATLRYNLLCGILVLFTLSVWITFWIEMGTPVTEQGHFRVGQIINAPGNHLMIIPSTTAPHVSFITRMVWFLNEYANVIFLAWLLLFVLKSLKMAGGLLYIQRIRNYKVHEVAEEFKHKIELFSDQIGIRQVVRLVQSELVKVPVAVGWLKPVILLPMGVILQLTTEQLESILWHELAHIRRRDYLVNILQGLVETVFFFNPGLLWLSSLIRAEREACCDDMVLSRMHRKANYLEALLAFGNEDNSRMPLAMSIGSGNELRDRLKRMVSKENKRLNMAEKVVLLIGLVVLSAFTTMPKTTISAAQNLVNVMIRKPKHADTVKTKIRTADSATKQIREFQQIETILSDTVHGKRNFLAPFRSVLFKNTDADVANNDISAEDTTGKKYHFIVADNKLVAMEINGEKIQESDLPKYQYLITQIDAALLEKRRIRETDMARFKANHPDVKFKAGGAYDKKHFINPRFYKDSIYNADLQKMDEIIADLVTRKVVTDANAVKWFALTDSQFLVNGQKQPDELQQRYKARYGVNEGYGLFYGPAPVKGKGSFIDPAGVAKERRMSDSIRFKRFNAQSKMDGAAQFNMKMDVMRQRLHDDSGNYSEEKDRALSVIADLVYDKVLAEPSSIKWFGLSNTEFIVNGQKQPDEMQQKYKAKYGIYEGNGLYYGPVQMHGRGVFIDADPTRPPLPPRPQKVQREPGSGYMQPKYMDSNDWKLRQLVKQQQAFAADQAKQRQKLMKDQQDFADDQAKKREEIQRWQQNYLHEQQLKMQQRTRRFDEQYKGTRIQIQDVMSNIAADLVSDNIVKDKSDIVGFMLTNKSLVVNGKTQPEDIHQKLKEKYLSLNGQYPAAKLLIDSELEQQNKQFIEDPNFGFHYDTKDGNLNMGVGISAESYRDK